MAKDVQTVVDSWASGMAQAGKKITDGVNAVTEAPGQKAAAAADLWQQRVSDPLVKAKFQRRSQAVSLQDWKTAMLTKGVNRVGAGAAASKPKFAKFMQQFLPFVQNVAAQVRQMPKGDINASIARMTAQVQGTAAFQYG